MQPPVAPTDGLVVDREGDRPTPINEDTAEQEESLDALALAWQCLVRIRRGRP